MMGPEKLEKLETQALLGVFSQKYSRQQKAPHAMLLDIGHARRAMRQRSPSLVKRLCKRTDSGTYMQGAMSTNAFSVSFFLSSFFFVAHRRYGVAAT
jgi:hypothetical protein